MVDASFFSTRRIGVILLTGFMLTACSSSPQLATSDSTGVYPKAIADPLEPFNRGVNSLNKGLLIGAVQPAGRVYRTVVPETGRRSVSNFSKNIGYPSRFVNNVLQGRWGGAGNESLRFLTNTTVGIGGLFNPASRWKIPESKATFSETFSKWGWQPNGFLMMPFFGPSDDLHLTEFAANKALEPYYYYPELAPVSGLATLNTVSGRADELARFTEYEADPYVTAKYFWSYSSREQQPNWVVKGPTHLSSLQTLSVVKIQLDDPDFAFAGKEKKVRLSSTGKKMTFNYWLQKHRAPLVYIAPGLGSHRLSSNVLTIAETLYQNGYSVVTVSGIFHPEFIENALTAALPAYPPVDTHNLLTVLAETNQFLEKKYPGKFGKRALVGFSLGGFQTLLLAAKEKHPDFGALHFDRYVAINPAVDLQYGDKVFDAYFKAPQKWPKAERVARADNAIHKVALYPFLPKELQNQPLFDSVESKYLVGLSFRLLLRDAIYSTQRRTDMGVLKSPLNNWRRQAAYDEILRYSFRDYVKSFALPYYQQLGITKSDFIREANLRTYQKELRANQKIRIIGNEDDFILSPRDVSWLRSTFKSSQVKFFPNGGHIGNLDTVPVEQAILKSVSGLK